MTWFHGSNGLSHGLRTKKGNMSSSVLHRALQRCLCRVAKVNYHLVAVAGDVFVRDHLASLVKVAYVDFEHDGSQGILLSPISNVIARPSQLLPLTTEYHLTSDSNPSLYRAPSTNEPYSNVSGDFNPIHTNPYFVAFASLPGTITHGMFTTGSTTTR